MASEAPKLAAWEDSDVQRLYEIFCADDLEHKPDDEHWEGYCSRWAVQSIVDPYRAKIAELERQMSELRAALEGKWISVKERLPEGDVIGTYLVLDAVYANCQAIYLGDGKWEIDHPAHAPGKGHKLSHVTHYQPLPTAPKEATKC